MPKWPIVLIAAIGGAGWLRLRHAPGPGVVEADTDAEPTRQGPAAPIEIRFGEALMAAWESRRELLLDRIATGRAGHERTFGFAHPAVRILAASELGGFDYQIVLHGVPHGGAPLFIDRQLALRAGTEAPDLPGTPGRDPAFGIPGVWIEPDQVPAARTAGYSVIDGETVLMTHFAEVVRAEMPALLTRGHVVTLLDQVRERQPGLVEELVPNVMTVSDIQRVLQNLLQERVSILNLDLILETLVDIGRTERDPVELTERIRQKLGVSICNALRGPHDDLAVLSLDPRTENRIITEAGAAGRVNLIGTDPRLAEQLLRRLAPLVDRMIRQGRSPVLLCATPLRGLLVRLTQRTMPQLSVISVDEVPARISFRSFDIVKLEPAAG